jgi:hypothetical protein
MKEAMKKNAPFQNEGIMSISKALITNVDSKVNRIVEGAKKQGIDFDKYNEQEVKYILELNRPKAPRVISADSPEGRGITKALLGRKESKVIKGEFGKPFTQEVKKRRGPVETTENMPGFGKVNVGIDYSASLNNPNYFGSAKNMYGDTARSGPEFFKQIKQFHLNQINRKKKEMVSRDHPNYKLLKKSLQDQEDSLTAAQIAEELGGNENMYDALRSKQISDPNAKPLKKSDYIKDSDPEDMATGGRVGLKAGMSKRAFLKLMGGAAAGIGALKTGALKLFGKGAAPVAEKTAEAASGAPSYFFDLVEKIKLLGVRSKGFKERSESFRYKDYDMDIDYDTGDIQIKKTREAMIPGGDEAGIAEESIMVYRPGRADELTKGKKPPDEYDEYTARPDMDGKMKDVDDGLSENVEKEIMEEVSEGGGNVDELTLQEIKKGKLASGGRVGLLSGGGVLRVILQNLAKQYGKKPSELLAVTNYKSLPPEVRKFLTKEQFEAIKKDMQKMRVEQFQNIRDMIENRQQFDKSSKALEKMGMNVSDTVLPKMMDKGPVPGGTTSDDLLMMEQIIKNLQMKDRKLNASGGLAGMLGE